MGLGVVTFFSAPASGMCLLPGGVAWSSNAEKVRRGSATSARTLSAAPGRKRRESAC